MSSSQLDESGRGGRTRGWPTSLAVSGVVALVVVVASGFLVSPGSRAVDRGPASVSSKEPGSLITAATDTGLITRMRTKVGYVARVVYRSTDADGRATAVSGVVVRPRGNPPKGGWPVLAVAHGTTGILNACAPSRSPDLLGQAELVIHLVSAGYAVALTDYQGLGIGDYRSLGFADEAHPYLDSPTAARNVIDSVRAVRALWPQISKRWAVLGISQGGGAAWSADELASEYAPELSLGGAVAIGPASDVSGLVGEAVDGTLGRLQASAYQWVLGAMGRTDDTFPLDYYRDAAMARGWDVMNQCDPRYGPIRDAALATITPTSLAPHSVTAADLMTRRLQRMGVAQRPLAAPLMVIYGGRDDLVDPQWTTESIARQRLLGGEVQTSFQPTGTHLGLDVSPMVPFLRAALGPSGGPALTADTARTFTQLRVR